MPVSVVIATCNRAASLRVTLDALRHQTYRDFEVVVVQGPCDDHTADVLAAREGQVKVVLNPERNLSKSRNLGIDAASGDIVAFVDDDGIPEPRWIEDLVAAYDDDIVGGTGGLVYDQSGVRLQYRYSVSDRVGRTDFDRHPPFDAFNLPGADPFLYLQGTNMSFRRTALEAIGGFDENIEYGYDEVDLALHLIDGGWRLRPLDGAVVHHKLLPSHLRRERGHVTDPYAAVKNRAYFALKNGLGHRPMTEVFSSLAEYIELLRNITVDSERHGRSTACEARMFLDRMEAGFDVGVEQATTHDRAGRRLAKRDSDAFLPYAVLQPPGGRLRLCLVSVDYPPGPMGGIARYTVDLAAGLAAQGHAVHVVTRSEPPYRVDFEDGVWVHRYPEGERFLPSLDGHPLRDNLRHVVPVWRTVDEIEQRFGLDLVVGNVWLAEALLCALDPRWPTVMVSATPIRTIATTQTAVAAKPVTAWQTRIEDIAVRRAAHLVPLSQANLETVLRDTAGADKVPATVVWLGLIDRAGGAIEPPRREDGTVEILFVGRLEPRKGIDTLLDAGIEVLRERPEARLRLAGANNLYASEDPRTYAERLDERLRDESDLRKRIVFEGEVSEERLDELFATCDVFCAPSRYESFGLMNVEAMMFSRPVVSCVAGGIPEVVVDGETGILVEPDDVSQLREALRRLIDDREMRERMGSAGRARFESEFDNHVAVSRMLDVFRHVSERGERPAHQGGEAAEQAVRQGLREVLVELGNVKVVDSAVDELLEPTAFPHDYIAPVVRLQHASDREFVLGLYQSILGREADPQGADAMTRGVSAGRTRHDVVREIATSDEARLLGVDARFLGGLGSGALLDLERRVRDAFWRDDQTFAETVADALFTPRADLIEDATAMARARLAEGGARATVLRELLGRAELRNMRAEAGVLGDMEFLTSDELEQRFQELAPLGDEAFIAGAYRVLVGREPDDEALGWQLKLGTMSRHRVLVALASSPEAQARGTDPVVVERSAAQIQALRAAPPRRGIDRVPGARRARRLRRRVRVTVESVLRDPAVGELRQEIDRHAGANKAAIRDLASLIAQGGEREAIDRLAAEARALEEHVKFVQQQLAVLEERFNTVEQVIAGVSDALQQVGWRLDNLPTGTHGAYLGDGRLLVNMTWGGKLLTPAADLSLTPDLVAHGIYERPFTNYLLRTLKPGDTVVDVGANIGMYTVLMANYVGPRGRVIAFEPNPDVLELLRENVALNWVGDRVEIRPTAVADRAGSLRLHVTERFMANSSVLEPGEAYFRNIPMDTVREVEVDTETLDALADELVSVDLIKIDVEGAERRVIEGMAGMLERGTVAAVAFEVYRERMGDEWPLFADLLRAYAVRGWNFYCIADDGQLIATDLEEILMVGRYAQVLMKRP
jgi:glycogen(starch) synthase